MTTDNLETGGPVGVIPHQDNGVVWEGMTARTYAAIHLGVPQSEHEFINDMIRERQRFELAKAAMQTLLGSEYTSEHGLHEGWQSALRHECFQLADAMLAEQEKK